MPVPEMIKIESTTPEESDRIRFVLFAFIAVALMSAFFTPSDLVAALFPQWFRYESSCIMLNVANIPCPFCGMSRAWKELTRLNFSRSVYFNPSAIPFFVATMTLMSSVFVLSMYNKKIAVSDKQRTILVLISVLLLIWILNILYGHQS
jgi:hypothetical protein